MRLPERFVESIKTLLGSDAEKLLACFEQKARSGIRVNTSKISLEQFEKKAPYGIDKIPFAPNGYYINDTDAWSKHPYYYAGLYYIQEPSAMIPANILPVNKGDIVLDLCAAPGGKSTQILLGNPGILISNDISYSRTIPLVKNLEHWGGNYTVTCMDPARLADLYPETFDSIIVDAPCSGEGMFRKDSSLISSYEDRGPGYYRPIQESILENAYNMLACDGKIVYSTCTFSDIEDEQVILQFVKDHPDIKVLDIDKRFGLSGPYEKYRRCEEIAGCVHAFPHHFDGEGHFVALMQKRSGNRKSHEDIICEEIIEASRLPECVKEFAGSFSISLYERFADSLFMIEKDGRIFMLPRAFKTLYRRDVRYSRTGIYLGDIKKSGKFVPRTAFALSIGADDFTNTISFDANDPNVIKFLKGETITIDGSDNSLTLLRKGIVLVCVDGFPLGFTQNDGRKLKNLYEKGWIYR